jgi:tetratricopeptide (TPR) repeat protein
LDRALTRLGARVEQDRRDAGLYPERELQLPANDGLNRAMRTFMDDFQARAQRGQLRPGEEMRVKGNQIQVTGQAAVMGVNAILTREIFERNPSHEFYVEESFPLDWMYPHLQPFGTIMKLERQPSRELEPETVERDRRFWSAYMERLMGDWVKPETNINEICDFAERVHRRHDLTGYRGSLKFIRDEQAQKAFSKLRGSIGGIYDWRFRDATGHLETVTRQLSQTGLGAAEIEFLRGEQRRLSGEQRRMFQEAEFAYKQAYALCPFSPEAWQRLLNLLLSAGRVDEALALTEASARLDPENAFYTNATEQLRRMRGSAG